MTFWAFKRGLVPAFFSSLLLIAFAGSAFSQASVCFQEGCFYPEVAKTAVQKQNGLMGRKQLGDAEGMLFVYDSEIRPAFWMKNMLIPLDFVWLDRKGQVVDLHRDVPPCGKECPSIVSRAPLTYVLEIPAGTVQKSGIEIGDHAVIQLGETT